MSHAFVFGLGLNELRVSRERSLTSHRWRSEGHKLICDRFPANQTSRWNHSIKG